jgi:hypothetical protein
MVKMQEEFKASRNGLKMTQAALETEKLKSAKHEQEAFTAQYQLVGMQEEYEKAKERIKVLEQERDGLKQNLKEEEVSRIAAEGRIALPPPTEDDDADLLASPSKSPRKFVRSSDSEKENVVPRKAVQLKSLQEELAHEKRLRQRIQDQVEFMKMECQFQCCSCRIAEKSGKSYVHDDSYLQEMERIKTSVPIQDSSMGLDDLESDDPMEEYDANTARAEAAESPTTGTFQHMGKDDELEDETQLGRDSMLRSTPALIDEPRASARGFASKRSSVEADTSHTLLQQETQSHPHPELQTEPKADALPTEQQLTPEQAVNEPQTPAQFEFRTVTTTTTVPIMFSPAPAKTERPVSQPSTPKTISHSNQYHLEASPFPSNALKADGTLDREAALELIRQRRGRARSVAMGQATPKKQMIDGNVRRDISAPALKTQTWTR